MGVNKYIAAEETSIDTLEVDNRAVRESQLRRLAEVRAARNPLVVEEALTALTHAAETESATCWSLPSRRRACAPRWGKSRSALEKVFGRYQATNRTISGVYSSESQSDPRIPQGAGMAEEFAQAEGRRPRILVAKMGQDGHDRGAKVIATAFADLGFDVDVGPLFQTPREAARMAAENDVHVLGVSTWPAATRPWCRN